MNIHRNAIKYQDEWQCHCCGKSWDVKDNDPPRCLTRSEINTKKLNEIRKQLSGD